MDGADYGRDAGDVGFLGGAGAPDEGSRVTFSEFVWAPSADALYFVGTSRGVTNLWKVAVEPQSLRWIAGPERLTTSAGLDADIALSADGKKLAFTARTEQSRIWSIPFDPAIGDHRPWPAHYRRECEQDMPALTADGKRMAFVARRSGERELGEVARRWP